ncbi:unnamed protein product, partial [Polarella glacialis]
MPMLRADGRRSCSIRCFICAAGAVALSVWQVQVSSNALPKLLVATASGVTASQKAVVLLAGVGTSGTSTPGGQRNVGRLFAEQLLSMGADVSCIARTAEAAEELKALGCRVAGVGDLTDETFAEEVLNAVQPVTLFTAVGGKDPQGQRVDG